MHIGIDGSRLHTSSPSGVEQFSTHLIPAFTNIARKKGHACTVYVRTVTNTLPSGIQRSISRKFLWTHLGLGPAARKDGIDVLFVPSHVLPLIRPKRCAVFLHDVCFEHAGYAYSYAQRWYLRLTSAEAVRNAAVFTHSPCTKEALRRIYGKGACSPQVVQPAPITIKKPTNISLRQKLRCPYLLAIGRVETRKNISVLLHAFDQLITRNPNIPHHLVLMGKDGYGAEKIHATHAHMKYADRVICTSYASPEEKDCIITQAAGIVHPSLCEGWSFVLSEARSAGKPFATSDIPVCREAGGEHGIYVKSPADPSAWTKALSDLIYRPIPPDPHPARTWETVAEECITILEKWYG